MNEVLNRIHLGITGNALCHATYGWFCAVEELPVVIDIILKDLNIVQTYELEVEL